MKAALDDWRSAPFDERVRATLGFLERLTLEPDAVGPQDVERVRAADVPDEALADAIRVCAFFNTIDRIADALGFEIPGDDYFAARAPAFLEGGYRLPPR